jgi:predicted RNase H-like HicB family nuclease
MDEQTRQPVDQEIHGVVFLDAPSGQYVAMCLELRVVTQGDSEEHAFEMLREAVEMHLEDTPRRELELTFQPVDSEPTIRTIGIRAPSPVGL